MNGAFAQPGETKELRLAVVLLRRRLACHLHARDDEGAPPARQGVRVARTTARPTPTISPASASTAICSRRSRTRTRRRSARGSSSTSSQARRREGSTASTSPRRLRTTAPRTRCASSGWRRATSERSCGARSWVPWQAPGSLAARARESKRRSTATRCPCGSTTRSGHGQGRKPADVESLMPPEHLLQLYVTTTDFYGYNRSITLAGPETDLPEETPSISDWRHRHVLQFRHGNGRDDFKDPKDNAALAFSARATSSFPGAFEPVSFQGFLDYLADRNAQYPDDFAERYFRNYRLSPSPAEGTFFVDGGVLDNRPFRHAIDAIKAKPATAEVDRRLLYLEPDPGSPAEPPRRARRAGHDRECARRAVRESPARSRSSTTCSLVSVMNERVRRVRDIIEDSFDSIDAKVRDARPRALRQGARGHLAGSDGVEDPGLARQRQRGGRAECRLRLFDVHSHEDQRHRRPLRPHRLRHRHHELPRRHGSGPLRQECPALLGPGSPAVREEHAPVGGSARVHPELRPRVRPATASLRPRGSQLVLPRPRSGAAGCSPREELDKVKARLSAAVDLLEQAMRETGSTEDVSRRLRPVSPRSRFASTCGSTASGHGSTPPSTRRSSTSSAEPSRRSSRRSSRISTWISTAT